MMARIALAVGTIGLFSLGILTSGCAENLTGANVRKGAAAYAGIPAPNESDDITEYKIGPLDTMDITVFQEPDISYKGVVVDASGNIAMPLIGQVHAADLTSQQLSAQLAAKLSEKFYVNPQVSVTVTNAVSQQVTVEGQVTEPGIYALKGPTTLLDAVALAKGETEVAANDRVVIIRFIGKQRMAAMFDLTAIRRGDEKDPAILGRDVVVVGHSATKQIYQDLIRSSPVIAAIFYHF